MATKPITVKGTRDFTPLQMRRRNYIFDTIKEVYRLHGYLPIETPAMETLSTLMGKYGEEGDKLLFKILNSGNFMEKAAPQAGPDAPCRVEAEDSALLSRNLLPKISEKGLRYDLTVPFARFVVQHQGEITFPFKRYQLQPVWRADRPQKGRYREFYQCDADVVGSDSLLYEAELVQMIQEVFQRLGIRVQVKINNRKILYGIAHAVGCPEKMTDITVAIDKLDKIGLEAVKAELAERGLPSEAVEKLVPVLLLQGDTEAKLKVLQDYLKDSEVGLKGIEEMRTLFTYIADMGLSVPCELDLTLARGLNYYTGAIFEVKAEDVQMGSICGGGRYDDLTGIFGLKGVSGVGISFGADRIYDVMNDLNLYPEALNSGTQVLFVNFGEKEAVWCFALASKLREAGISVEIYPSAAKLGKQFSYADSLHIPFVAVLGEKEHEQGVVVLKDMKSGEQTPLTLEEIIKKIQA
ncbi:histidine--tRNA ligase [bacterium]|nr:histidine--tRNA ligase [bacterium]